MVTWDDFFVAQVGASAALAGLLFVGLSINLAKIVGTPALPDRALNALMLLAAILLVSSIFLIPGQAGAVLGAEVLVVGGAIAAASITISRRSLAKTPAPYHRFQVMETGVVATAVLLYPLAGAVLLAGYSSGPYLVVPAVLTSYAIALIDSWVMLVEINR